MKCWQQGVPSLMMVFVVVVEVSALQLAPNYRSLVGHQVWSVEGQLPKDVLSQMLNEGLVDPLDHHGSQLRIRISAESIHRVGSLLKQAGLPHQVLVDDLANHLQKLDEEEEEEEEKRKSKRDTVTRAQTCNGSTSCPAPLDRSYMSFSQMEYYLQHIATNPRVELISIGKSVEDRDIWMVHLKRDKCQQNSQDESRMSIDHMPERSAWIEGGLHAREWISPAVALHLIHKILAENCSVINTFDIYVVPMSNPDGYQFTRTGNRYWRKNRSVNQGTTCRGVDLNRNWDNHWGEQGVSSNPCSEVYMGKSAFSEPETNALKEAMLAVNRKRNLSLVVCLHSYGQILMYPYGWTSDVHPDEPQMKNMGQIFAKSAERSSGTKYTVENAAGGLYLASGATDDWAKDTLGTPFVYTLELRNRNTFLLPAIQIVPTSVEVWDGLFMLLNTIAKEKTG